MAPNPGHIPIPATQTSSQPGPPVITQPKYLELCINHGKLERRLGEVDVSNINSDGQLFRQIKRTYDTVRGYRSKWFLLEPTSIQFVKVSTGSVVRAGYNTNDNLIILVRA